MKTNTKVAILTALTLAVLPTVALAADTTTARTAAVAAAGQVTAANTPKTDTRVAYSEPVRFNYIDGEPIR